MCNLRLHYQSSISKPRTVTTLHSVLVRMILQCGLQFWAPFEEAFDVIEKIQQEVTRRIFYIKPAHLVSLKMYKEIRVL